MRVVFAAGGTAGHIKPALVVARRLRENRQAEVTFVGYGRGLERQLVPAAGFPLELVAASGWQRNSRMGNARTLWQLGRGVWQAWRLLARLQPQVVVGMGGFVSIPVVLAARLRGIPVLLHEQNAWPGLANRRLARFARTVAVPFPGMEDYFPGARKIVRTGTPVEPDLLSLSLTQARNRLGMEAENFLLLVFGGSRGAAPINEVMLEAAPRLIRQFDLNLVWIAGEINHEELRQKLAQKDPELLEDRRFWLEGYRQDMPELLVAADLVMCRAGATTLAELTARGIPAVLVPSSYVVDDHQRINATRIQKEGAGVVLPEEELNAEALLEVVQRLKSDGQGLKRMATQSRALGTRDAAQRLEELVVSFASSSPAG